MHERRRRALAEDCRVWVAVVAALLVAVVAENTFAKGGGISYFT